MSERSCERCGHTNPSEANFCSSCGAALDVEVTASVPAVGDEGAVTATTGDVPAADIEAAAADRPAGLGMLVVKRGPNAGSRWVLERDVVTVGRHPDSVIFLDDVTVSRRHAELRRTGDAYVVVDVGSLNGTYLNRERVEEGRLSNLDELQVGRFKLLYFADPSDGATP